MSDNLHLCMEGWAPGPKVACSLCQTFSALTAERDALALELQSVKDALAQVVAENTANVAALAEAERAQRADAGELSTAWGHIDAVYRAMPPGIRDITFRLDYVGNIDPALANALRNMAKYVYGLSPEPPAEQPAAPAAPLPACKGGTGTCTNEWCGPCYG